MTTRRGKIYITDAGMGPIVRQSAILEEMLKRDSALEITLQTRTHLPEARAIMPGLQFVDRFNNLDWPRTAEGSPDVEAMPALYADYPRRAEAFIATELAEFRFDFVISDFVHEAFPIARMAGTPAFGVAHFTWDWFFEALGKPELDALVQWLSAAGGQAPVVYFPPFTPPGVLKRYAAVARQVPFIVRSRNALHRDVRTPRFNVLLTDSGSGVLERSIQRALDGVGAMSDFHFFVSDRFASDAPNVTRISRGSLFVDYIPQMDLVIGRAGFNTISECIAYRVPLLLLSESLNPEMASNIEIMERQGLGAFLPIDTDFGAEFGGRLTRFLRERYADVRRNMNSHEYRLDGAAVVAEDILERLASAPRRSSAVGLT